MVRLREGSELKAPVRKALPSCSAYSSAARRQVRVVTCCQASGQGPADGSQFAVGISCWRFPAWDARRGIPLPSVALLVDHAQALMELDGSLYVFHRENDVVDPLDAHFRGW